MGLDMADWGEFFQILAMHRTGFRFNLEYERVIDMDDVTLAKALFMGQPPDGDPLSITREAIEWLQESEDAA